MLVLSRKPNEAFWVGSDVRIVVQHSTSARSSFGIEAPRHIPIVREELKGVRDERIVARADWRPATPLELQGILDEIRTAMGFGLSESMPKCFIQICEAYQSERYSGLVAVVLFSTYPSDCMLFTHESGIWSQILPCQQ